MADDLAVLGFGVESQALKTAVDDLQKVQVESRKTETATERLLGAMDRIDRSINAVNTSVGRLGTSYNKTTAATSQAASASDRMVSGMSRVGKASLEANMANERLIRGMSQANVTANSLSNTIGDGAGSGLAGRLKGFVASLIGLEAARRGLNTMRSFSQEISNLQSVAGATGDEMLILSNKAQELGRSTRYTASDAAAAMTELAKAGFDANEVLGSIDGTLTLAQAGGVGLAEAAEITANALNGMRLSVEDTNRVADVLVKTANDTVSGVRDIGEAFAYVAPIASGMKVGLEETAAAIGVLSDAGIQGSSAGTGLRRVLSELEAPSKAATDLLGQMGLKAEEVRISQVGLTQAIDTLAKAGIDTGLALQLFGDRGGPAFEVLASGLPKVQELTNSLGGAAGEAQRVATIMNDNLNTSFLNMFSAIEGLVLGLGDAGLTAAIRFVVDALTLLINGLTYLSPLLIGLGSYITGVMIARAFVPLVAILKSSAFAMLGLNTATAGATTIWAAFGMVLRAHPVIAMASILITVVSIITALSNATITWGEKTYTVSQIISTLIEIIQVFLKEVFGLQITMANLSKNEEEAAKKAEELAKAEKEAAKRAAELAKAQADLAAKLNKTGKEADTTTARIDELADSYGYLDRGTRRLSGGYSGLGQTALAAAASTYQLRDASNDNARALHTTASAANSAASAYANLSSSISSASEAAGGGGGGGHPGNFGPNIAQLGSGTRGSFQFQRSASQEEIASARNAAISNAMGDALGRVTSLINTGRISRDQAAALYDAIWDMAGGPTMESISRLAGLPGGNEIAGYFRKLKNVQYAGKVLLPGTRIPGLRFDPKMTSAFPELAGFRGGGSFRIPGGGSGGDNIIPIFRAKRGESVHVTPSGARGGDNVTIQINNYGDMGTPDQARQTSKQLAIQMERSLKKVRKEA